MKRIGTVVAAITAMLLALAGQPAGAQTAQPAGQPVALAQTFSATGAASVGLTASPRGLTNFQLTYTTTGSPSSVSVSIQGSVKGDFSDAATCGAAATGTTSGTISCSGVYGAVRTNVATLGGGTTPTLTATLVASPTGATSGPSPSGSAQSGNPIPVGGVDKNLNAQTLAMSTSGQAQVLNPGFGPSFAAVASTATFTSGATLTLGRTYDIFLTYAGVTGTYTTCTVQPQAQDVAGNVASIGSAQATTPGNGTTVITNLTAAGTAMRFVFACAAYGTAGTLIINPVFH